ncbi:MAG: hypothetical protein WDM78_22000 [Puia sp.]
MPQLTYYIDDSLEYVDKMETLFKEINETKPDKEMNPDLINLL